MNSNFFQKGFSVILALMLYFSGGSQNNSEFELRDEITANQFTVVSHFDAMTPVGSEQLNTQLFLLVPAGSGAGTTVVAAGGNNSSWGLNIQEGAALEGVCAGSTAFDFLIVSQTANAEFSSSSMEQDLLTISLGGDCGGSSSVILLDPTSSDPLMSCLSGTLGADNAATFDPDGDAGSSPTNGGVANIPPLAGGEQIVCALLPIRLLSFQAKAHKGDADLVWNTAAEINGSHFEIERSLDGQDWAYINSVEAVGESRQIVSYSYTDIDVVGDLESDVTAYYRLRMVDNDGSFEYSEVRAVRFGDSNTSISMRAFPNPTQNTLHITLQNPDSELSYQVVLHDLSGRQVYSQVMEGYVLSLDLANIGLENGLYHASLIENNRPVAHKKIVLVK